MNENRFSIEAKSDSDITGYFAYAAQRAVQYYKLLFVLLGVSAVLTLIYVHLSDPLYMAVAALTPPKDALLDAAGLQGASGIASITKKLGIGGGPTNGNEDLFDQYTRVLRSYRLAGALTNRPEFLALAFPKYYDPKTRHLKPRAGFSAMAADGVKAILGLPLVSDSEEDRVFRFLKENLSISTPHEATTDISEISFRYDDRYASQRILDIVLEQADLLMRADRHKDIASRIVYLENQLTKTTFEDQRESIISLLTTQQNTMMVITADHRYASYIVEPPHTPQKPSWPDIPSEAGLIVFLALTFWGGAIFLLPQDNALLRRFSREQKVFARTRRSKRHIPDPIQTASSHGRAKNF
jgi:hypothetical protein